MASAPWFQILLALGFLGKDVSAAPSTLKVAICNPGSIPYANTNAGGSTVGFDAGDLNCKLS
jgi:hypothetical protein